MNPPMLTFGNGSTMTFGRVMNLHDIDHDEDDHVHEVRQRNDQLTGCLAGRNMDDVWAMAKLPPTTGCPPTVAELSEGILRRLDYAIRERSQDPYDIEILWSLEENCYVVIGCTDSEARHDG